MTRVHPIRRRRKGLLNTWAGDSLWRRFVAWLVQSAVLVAIGALLIAIIWLALVPWMIDGFVDMIRR